MRSQQEPEVDRQRTRLFEHREASPSVGEIAEALEEIATHDIPGSPPVGAVRLLNRALTFPVSVGGRTIKTATVTQGDPQHGALRSDAHISRYEAIVPEACPECESHLAVYEYDVHHNIAGSVSFTCRRCDHVYEEDDW